MRSVLLCCFSVALLLGGILAVPAAAQTLAFPEAEGFGRFASGARTNLGAASVYHVTNLNDSGAGSFRDAVSQPNRFVVFDVGGIVNLTSALTFSENLTIAGQTAPGGFVVHGDRAAFHGANNLVSRHWGIHMGVTGDRDDAASIVRGHDLIFDHMSITWGVDGTFDINPDSGQVIDNMTIQNTIVSQGLDVVGHSTGGLMQPGDGGSVSVIRSLWADNVTRNPKVRGENEFINNVVYGYENAGYIMGDTAGSSYANVEGNYFIEGPVNGGSPFSSGTPTFNIYASDNWVDPDRDGVLDGTLITSYPGANLMRSRHNFPTTPSMTAQEAVEYVARNAGQTIIRDVVDKRLEQEVLSYGTFGGVIERESHIFDGYGEDPVYLNPRAGFADADNDGVGDNWEASRGLSSANPSDWKNLSGDYTQLEHYLNELGAESVTTASSGGAWTSIVSWDSGVPSLAHDAAATGTVTHASGHGFARRLSVAGSLNITGGTINVVDTATLNGAAAMSGGELSAGRVLIGSTGQSGTLLIENGATLRTGTVAKDGGSASLGLNGGVFLAGGAPDIAVPTALFGAGGVFDTAGHSGAISGPVTGDGPLTKRGAGSLALSGGASYTGPTTVEEGTLVAMGAGLKHSSAIEVAGGATVDASGVLGGLSLGTGKSLGGAGKVIGNVNAAAGSVVRPEGTVGAMVSTGAIAIQAEDLALGGDWAVFDNDVHGTGAGGSYNGDDLSGGGIVLVSGESLAGPTASGAATTTVEIPQTDGWYLFAKVAEPAVSPIPGDSATQPGGNNSLWVSQSSSSLAASLANFDEVQTYANPGDEATWNRLSPTLGSLEGVVSPLNAGVDYFLAAGEETFTIYGREIGTVLDAFVLSDTNLTAEQLEAVLSGPPPTVLTVEGDFTLASGAMLAVEVAGGDTLNKLSVTGAASLGGDLSLTLADGFTPQASEVFEVLGAGSLSSQFANAAPGARVALEDGPGSFVVNYDYANDLVTLSEFVGLLQGDFNGDGSVDAADFTVWRDHLGESDESAILSAGDGLGGVDQADYDLWVANFGASYPAPEAASVPEPASLATLLAAAVLAALRRRTL
ncbi:autotransporter-associated beta strand repeat-containing protein [Pseudobythopirellula maris]|nr:autotransporter-associated beta strand repeat-containing protein [Pseudobythopirellula maris]